MAPLGKCPLRLFADDSEAAAFHGKSYHFDYRIGISHWVSSAHQQNGTVKTFDLNPSFFFLAGLSPKEKANSSGRKGLPSVVSGPARDK